MRQLFLEQIQHVTLREAPRPSPEAHGVVLKIHKALTCGTDLKTIRRGHPKFPLPTPLGHEAAGVITQIGPDVQNWQVGDEVMFAPTAPCLHCDRCFRGLYNLCLQCMQIVTLGAFADELALPAPIVAQNLIKKPVSLSWEKAALLEPLACIVEAQRLLPMTRKESLWIIGNGPIGLLHALHARHVLNWSNVRIFGRENPRLELAHKLGFSTTVVPRGEQLRLVTRAVNTEQPQAIVECTGQLQVWEECLQITPPHSQLLFYGGCKKGTALNLKPEFLHQGQQLQGVFHFSPASVHRAAKLLEDPSIPWEELITHELPLEQYEEAFRLHQSGVACKVAFDLSCST